MNDKTLQLIADTLVEILEEMRRNRPASTTIVHDPKRVHVAKNYTKAQSPVDVSQSPLVKTGSSPAA